VQLHRFCEGLVEAWFVLAQEAVEEVDRRMKDVLEHVPGAIVATSGCEP
jgi:hypothetical protein